MLISDPNVTNDPNVTAAPEPLTLAWGGPAPEGATVAWGARAIYSLKHHDTKRAWAPRGKLGRVLVKAHTECMIDLLYDRQAGAGGTEADRAALGAWINRVGIPAIKRACVKSYLTGDSDESVTVERDGYVITASPRSSYGYLYLTAWKVG
jgi:hypothetical protein